MSETAVDTKMTALTVREEADIEGEWVSGDRVLLNLILIMER